MYKILSPIYSVISQGLIQPEIQVLIDKGGKSIYLRLWTVGQGFHLASAEKDLLDKQYPVEHREFLDSGTKFQRILDSLRNKSGGKITIWNQNTKMEAETDIVLYLFYLYLLDNRFLHKYVDRDGELVLKND